MAILPLCYWLALVACRCILFENLVKTFRIPLDLHPRLPDSTFTMDHLTSDAIGIYFNFLWFYDVRIPFLTFLLSVLKYFKVHISQLVPLGLNKVVSFEVVCRDLNIVPTVTLFHVFKCLCKQGDWLSFSKRQNTEDGCMDDGPSSSKKWKSKFFLIDRRAIPDHLTLRHSHSCVSDDLSTDGYDRNDVERLRVHLIHLCEMREELGEISIYDFMTLPSWGDAKIVEEPHHLFEPLLERVPSYTTAPAAEDALIPLPTPDEERTQSTPVTVSEPSQPSKKRRLRIRALEAGSSAPELGQADSLNEADIINFCMELKDSMKRDKGTFIRAASVPTPRLGKRLVISLLVVVASVSGPAHVGTSAPASTSGCSLALGGSSVGSFVGMSKAEDMQCQMDLLDTLIELTLFPLAPGPYHMPYPYEGVSFPLYTKEEWDGPHAPESNILCKDIFKDPDICRKALDRTITPAELRRTESLLPLELLNRVNVLSALLVSHGYELNSRYTDLVASKVRLQERFYRKKRDVKLLRSEVTSLENKLEKVQRDCDALGQENRELHSLRDVTSTEVKKLQSQLADARVAFVGLTEELSRADAKLSKQALTVRDLQNELALERSRSQGYKDAADELKTEVTQFIGSGVEGLVRRFLSSDEFHVALTHVASLGINYGVERGCVRDVLMLILIQLLEKFLTFILVLTLILTKLLLPFPLLHFPFLARLLRQLRCPFRSDLNLAK
ncbi:hypothetical protein Tco_1221467 [Tanacetum coccineum]